MTTTQARRLREHRSRVLIRDFEYRQRRHAHGVWFRLRRVLTFARKVYAVSREDAESLMADGFQPEPVGLELAPPRVLLVLPAERIAKIASARPLAVRLNAEMLSAECLALVAFEP